MHFLVEDCLLIQDHLTDNEDTSVLLMQRDITRFWKGTLLYLCGLLLPFIVFYITDWFTR